MLFQEQNDINNGWNQFIKQLPPKKERKYHYCPKCGKEHYRVRMEYLGNVRQQEKLTVYNIEQYKCPRCGYLDEKTFRIEGKGTLGHNSGKRFGTL